MPTRLSPVLMLLFLVGLGCGQGGPSTGTGSTGTGSTGTGSTGTGAEDGRATGGLDVKEGPIVREDWHAIHLGGKPAGYAHTWTKEGEWEGRKVVRIRSEQRLNVTRAGDVSRQLLHLSSLESPEGELLACDFEMDSGEAPLRMEGRTEGETLWISQSAGAQSTELELEWQPAWGGYFAIEESLRRRPLAAGESRELVSLVPGLTDIARVRLVATDYAPEEVLGTARTLLRVDAELRIDKAMLRETLWCDEHGEVVKLAQPDVGVVSYRTTKETALAAGEGEASLDAVLAVAVEGPLDRPHERRHGVYRVRLDEGDPLAVFPTTSSQTVRPIDERTVEIDVRRVAPGEAGAATVPAPGAEPSPEATNGTDGAGPPTDADRGPTSLIESDDERVRELALSVAADEQAPARVALALERLVHERVRSKNYSRAFDSAATVAEQLEGDCTEHAVLLAALCRARGIPARVASGLVATRDTFAYHMWTLAWLDGRWVPLDATLGRGGIGAGHLQLATGDPERGNPLDSLLPVLQVLGRLRIEVSRLE